MKKKENEKEQELSVEEVKDLEFMEKQSDRIAELMEELAEKEDGERVEKLLKNEAYCFILAEGLLDKFLEFRQTYHRTKTQNALYTLVLEADLGGLWLDWLEWEKGL